MKYLLLMLAFWLLVVATIILLSMRKNTNNVTLVNPRDYQIEYYMDTVWVYDGERLVSSFIQKYWNSQLDSAIIKDNQ